MIMNAKPSKTEVLQRLNRMCDNMNAVEGLSDNELAEKLGMLGGDIDSEQCSVIGEVLRRWRHPWKHRLDKIKKLCQRPLK